MSRRLLKICAQYSYSVKVGRSERCGVGARARPWQQVKESNSRMQPRRQWIRNLSIASNQTMSDPCAKQSLKNGQDLRRLISRPMTTMNLWLSLTIACMKKPDTRKALRITLLPGWGVKKGSYAYNCLFFLSSYTFKLITFTLLCVYFIYVYVIYISLIDERKRVFFLSLLVIVENNLCLLVKKNRRNKKE